ncbi:MAG: single-stranded DNA-binding protein [Candidatus Cloacimonadales bacterium]|nr:single-stranded DNA-binding protein [Candidatus Cloacimonadales bacterium]
MSLRPPSINNVSIAGNIVRDAVVNHVGTNNVAVTTITVAHNQRYRGKDDKWQETVAFIDVEVWGTLADRAEEFYKKGVPVIVEGSLKSNSWKDKEGKSHSRILVRADRIHILSFPDKKDGSEEEEE